MDNDKILYLDINDNFRLKWNFYWDYIVNDDIKKMMFKNYLPKKCTFHLIDKLKVK